MCGVSFLMIFMMFTSRISWATFLFSSPPDHRCWLHSLASILDSTSWQCEAIKLWRVKKYDFFLWARDTRWKYDTNTLEVAGKTGPTNFQWNGELLSAKIHLLHNEKVWKQCSSTCPALPSHSHVDVIRPISTKLGSILPDTPSPCRDLLSTWLHRHGFQYYDWLFIPECNLMLLAPLRHKKGSIE